MEEAGLTQRAARARWLVLGLALAALAAIFVLKAHAPDTVYLGTSHETGWIVPGLVKNPGAYDLLPTRVTFARSFDLGPSGRRTLDLRTLGEHEVRIDGRIVGAGLLPELGEGEHELEVHVSAPAGPVALWARLIDPAGAVVLRSDPSWTYTINGSSAAPARLASDPWIGASYDTDDLEPIAVWGHPWLTIGFGAAAIALLALARRPSGAPLSERAPGKALAGLAALWIFLLALAVDALPRWAGYDTEGHLEYVEWIRTKGTLPYPTDGWQTYHPPLYYLLAAGVLSALDLPAGSDGGVRALRLLNVALAAGFLLAAARAIERLCGRRPSTSTIGLVLAGATPAAFYMLAYPTNENLCLLMASLVFLAIARLRGRRIESWRSALLVGALLGLALLTKFTAIVLVVPVAAVYLLRAAARLRARGMAAALTSASCLGVALGAAVAMSGWHYARTYARFGTPIVTNWDPVSGHRWWQLPGFRTAHDYLPDPGAFAAPFFAGFESVWSGFLATWAGDTQAGGSAHVNTRPPWNYELTPVAMLLGVVFAALVLAGIASRVRWRRLRAPRTDAAMIATVVATVSLLLWLSLAVPVSSQPKAFYGLVALVPAATLAARGARKLWGRSLDRARPVSLFLAPWVIVLAGTFLVLPRPANRVLRALAENDDGRRDEAIATLERAVAATPDDMNARTMLATLLADDASREGRVRELIGAGSDATGAAASRRAEILSRLEARAGRSADAVRLARRAVDLAPERPRFWLHAIDTVAAAGDIEGAIALAKDGIRWHPWSAEFQERIATLLERAGRSEEARRFRLLREDLRPPA